MSSFIGRAGTATLFFNDLLRSGRLGRDRLKIGISMQAPIIAAAVQPRRRKNPRLAFRIMILSAFGVLLSGASLTSMAWRVLQAGATTAAMERVDTNMRVAWDVLRANGRTFTSVDGKLLADGHVLNDDLATVDKIKSLVGGTSTVFLGDLAIATNVRQPDGTRAVGTRLARGAAYDAVFDRKTRFRGEIESPRTPVMTAYDPIVDSSGNVLGVLHVGIEKSDFMEPAHATLSILVYSTLAAVLLAMAISYVATRPVTRVLRQLTGAMHRLASGDLQVVLPGLYRGDDVGEIAQAAEAIRIKAVEQARNDAIQERGARRIAEQAQGKAMQEMADAVEREANIAVGEVAAGTDHMASNAAQMTDSALLLGKNSSNVAAAAEEALTNAETVAKASSQLTASISEISVQIDSSRTLALEAVTASGEAQATMAKLSEAAGKIGAVTNLITEIAGQTNLLALNATIEAARAGESGRGFAVVAAEVKSLAEQTAKATGEIAQQINEIQDAARASVDSIVGIGEVIRKVEAVSSSVAAAIREQSAFTVEISRSVEETSDAAREVAAQIVSVSNEAIETGRRALVIRDGSAEIAGKVADLRATLVRVIRTSTTEVDRRSSTRVDVHCPASLTIEGRSLRVIIRDLSLGGAIIEDGLPDAPIGTSMTLVIDGIPTVLAGAVGLTRGTATLVKFQLSDEADRLVSSFISARLAA
jgi:methyl-accepting chemotaxis protein